MRFWPLFAILACCPGCLVLVASAGKHVEEDVRACNTSKQVSAQLGRPVLWRTFDPPLPAKSVMPVNYLWIPEWVDGEWRNRRETELVGGWEDYEYHGWVYNELNAQGFFVVDVFSLGLSELDTPILIWQAIDHASAGHRFRVWYDASGRVFDVREYHHPTEHRMIENGTDGHHEYQWHDPPAPAGDDPQWVY